MPEVAPRIIIFFMAVAGVASGSEVVGYEVTVIVIALPSRVARMRMTSSGRCREQSPASAGTRPQTERGSCERLWRGRALRRFAGQFHRVTPRKLRGLFPGLHTDIAGNLVCHRAGSIAE